MPGSRREPALKLDDGSCMVLGRRGTFLGEETEDMAQLLNCRGKNVQMGEENLYSYLPTKKSLHELEFNCMFGIPMRIPCADH